MPSLLAGYLPNYEPKSSVAFTPVPAEQTFPWNPRFKPKAVAERVSPSARATSPLKGKKRAAGAGKRRITMPETCWVPGCQGHMRVGRGGTAAGFCAQHWRRLPRLLRIELLLARVRRARFEHFLAQAFTALDLPVPAALSPETLAEPSEKR